MFQTFCNNAWHRKTNTPLVSIWRRRRKKKKISRLWYDGFLCSSFFPQIAMWFVLQTILPKKKKSMKNIIFNFTQREIKAFLVGFFSKPWQLTQGIKLQQFIRSTNLGTICLYVNCIYLPFFWHTISNILNHCKINSAVGSEVGDPWPSGLEFNLL